MKHVVGIEENEQYGEIGNDPSKRARGGQPRQVPTRAPTKAVAMPFAPQKRGASLSVLDRAVDQSEARSMTHTPAAAILGAKERALGSSRASVSHLRLSPRPAGSAELLPVPDYCKHGLIDSRWHHFSIVFILFSP
jgi:hypothetical protein